MHHALKARAVLLLQENIEALGSATSFVATAVPIHIPARFPVHGSLARRGSPLDAHPCVGASLRRQRRHHRRWRRLRWRRQHRLAAAARPEHSICQNPPRGEPRPCRHALPRPQAACGEVRALAHVRNVETCHVVTVAVGIASFVFAQFH